MQYTLKIMIDEEARSKFNASDQQVLIIKSFEAVVKTAVVWAAFLPVFTNNSLEFESQYGLYASLKSITLNTKADPQTKSAAVSGGHKYILKDGTFNSGGSISGNERFGIINQQKTAPPRITVGLWQDICVNGNKIENMPVNAAELNYQEMALFRPLETVKILAGSNILSSQIIDSDILMDFSESMIAAIGIRAAYTTVGPYLSVDLSQNNSQTIHYDNKTNTFVPGELPGGSI